MTYHVVGLVGNESYCNDMVHYMGEIIPKMYHELYKTSGRKEVIIKHISIKKLAQEIASSVVETAKSNNANITYDLDITFNGLVDMLSHSLVYGQSTIWHNMISNLIRKENYNGDVYIFVDVTDIQVHRIVSDYKGKFIYIQDFNKPITKTDEYKLKWKGFKEKDLAYTYNKLCYWYKNDKTRQYMKSFCVDFMYASNDLF